MIKLVERAYYVVESDDQGTREVWQWVLGGWYRPGNEEKWPRAFAISIIRRVRL